MKVQPGVCPVCKQYVGEAKWWDHHWECMEKWAKEHKCPWSWSHGPDEIVISSTTHIGKYTDENGKVRSGSRSVDKEIKYKDWEWRCRICYPRDLK